MSQIQILEETKEKQKPNHLLIEDSHVEFIFDGFGLYVIGTETEEKIYLRNSDIDSLVLFRDEMMKRTGR